MGTTSKVEVTGSRFTAMIYDPFLWLGERLGMRARRRRLLSATRGRVLEIGAGTGLNLSYYPDEIDELVLAEPVEPMADRLERRRSKLGHSARIVLAPAEALPFEDGSFDTVVSTLVLCTVADPEATLAEVRRVLRPGGRLLFCEHVRFDSARMARWQDRLADAWAGFADGCRCNRETLATISSQLEIVAVERARWRGMPRIVRPLVVGEARRAVGGFETGEYGMSRIEPLNLPYEGEVAQRTPELDAAEQLTRSAAVVPHHAPSRRAREPNETAGRCSPRSRTFSAQDREASMFPVELR